MDKSISNLKVAVQLLVPAMPTNYDLICKECGLIEENHTGFAMGFYAFDDISELMINACRPKKGEVGQIHYGVSPSGVLGLVFDVTKSDGLEPKFRRAGWLQPCIGADIIKDLLAVGHGVFAEIVSIQEFLHNGKMENYSFKIRFDTENPDGETIRKHPIVFDIPIATPLRYGCGYQDARYPECVSGSPIYFSKGTRGYKVAKLLQCRGLPHTTEDVYKFVSDKEARHYRDSLLARLEVARRKGDRVAAEIGAELERERVGTKINDASDVVDGDGANIYEELDEDLSAAQLRRDAQELSIRKRLQISTTLELGKLGRLDNVDSTVYQNGVLPAFFGKEVFGKDKEEIQTVDDKKMSDSDEDMDF